MIRVAAIYALLAMAVPAWAELPATPSLDDPRVQTAVYRPGVPLRIVSFPDSTLKLIFRPNETIERAVLSDRNAFRASVVGYGDTIELEPLNANAVASMQVQTNLHLYEFKIETGEDMSAAYIVRLISAEGGAASDEPQPAQEVPITHYRLSGDKVVRPDSIYDDGTRTFIEWHPDKALPAVFGVGPGNDEEVVAGYMREGVFVVDRIYPELVFRFDKERAKAKRRVERD